MNEVVEGRVPAQWQRRVKQPRRPRQLMTLPMDEQSPPLGLEMGSLRLETRLGAGGQGSVYRARRGGRLYAIKFLSLDLAEWAWRELEVRLRLRRVGSVRFLGCGLWPDTRPRFLYLLMPYVRGRPLYVWAKQKNPTARDVARVLLEVARQLVEIHRAGVVHRDIKGANVLVRHRNGKPVLVDFGLGTWPGAPEITNPLGVPGTRHYRSPEALRFRRECAGEHYQARTSNDLWALGVVLYCLLTGSYPFDTVEPTADDGALADVILKEEPEPPHTRNPRVPRALSELCLRMLEKSLEARFQDAEALSAELEAVMAEADGSWDMALCEAWSPEDATTPQEEGLGLGEWMDKARRLKLYARMNPRRGGPLPSEEASTLPHPPTATPRESISPPPPQTPRPRWHAVAWGALALGLVSIPALLHSPSTPATEISPSTLEVISTPTMLEVTKSGQELASESKTLEGERSAAPEEATTPALVANATPKKDSTRVKTPRQLSPPQQKQSTVLNTTGKTCLLIWTAGQFACASPAAEVRSTMLTMPQPAECPAGSVETMAALGLEPGIEEYPIMGDRTGVITVRQGPGAKLTLTREWEKLPANTDYLGEFIFGADGRVYGRFTQARTPEGQVYSVCFDLYDSETDGKRGVVMEPGSTPDNVKIFTTVKIIAVDRFK